MKTASLVALGLCLAPFLVKAQVQVDPSMPSYQPAGELSGSLASTGDDDMESLMNRWVALFKEAHPGVQIHVDVGTSATAPGTLAAGKADISYVGRLMLDREAKRVASAWGHEATPITVSGGTFADKEKTHAEMVWVNGSNPIKSLSLAQLDAIYGSERRRGGESGIVTWGDLGLTGEWAARPIRILKNSSIGASQYFKDTILEGGEWRNDVKALANVQDVTAAVAQDPYAIGLAGFGYGDGLKIRALPIGSLTGRGVVEPTLENSATRRYPLARLVYIYVNRTPGEPLAPIVKEFLRAVLSKEGQEAALQDGYLPLSAERVKAERAKLD